MDSLSFKVGDLIIILTFSDCNGETIEGFPSSLLLLFFFFIKVGLLLSSRYIWL